MRSSTAYSLSALLYINSPHLSRHPLRYCSAPGCAHAQHRHATTRCSAARCVRIRPHARARALEVMAGQEGHTALYTPIAFSLARRATSCVDAASCAVHARRVFFVCVSCLLDNQQHLRTDTHHTAAVEFNRQNQNKGSLDGGGVGGCGGG